MNKKPCHTGLMYSLVLVFVIHTGLIVATESDQPAHSRSLIRGFADRMCLLQPPGYQTKKLYHTGWMFRLIWVFAGHKDLIVATKPTISLCDQRRHQLTDSMRHLQPQGYPKCNKRFCHTGWMYWLIWVFAGHTCLIVVFVVRLFIFI